MTIFYSLASVTVISLISLVSVFALAFKEERLKKVSLLLVSFAVGGLFGDAFIHLLPESFQRLGFGLETSLLIILGIFVFFSLERFLRWRHCHEADCPKHGQVVATVNLIGDAAHNLIDGMVIAASFLVSPALGLATTLAVVFHEIPHEIGNFGILVHYGLTPKKALLLNFLSGLVAILGALIVLIIGSRSQGFSLWLLPVTAGGFIYIAGSDLLPGLHEETKLSTSLWQIFFILLGLSLMASLKLFA